MWWRPISRYVFLLLLTGTMGLSACSSFGADPTPTSAPIEMQDTTPLISSTGVVVPQKYSTLSVSAAGLVEEVLVEEGQQVEAGETLVRLKGQEDLQAAVAAAQAEVIAAQEALDDLNDNNITARSEALQEISLANEALAEAKRDLFYFNIPSTQADLDTMEAILVTMKNLDQARADFEPYKNEISLSSDEEDLKEAMQRAQREYDAALNRLEYETALQNAQSRLEKAQQDYEQLKDGPDPGQAAVAGARLDNAKAALQAAEARLDDLVFTAQFPGTVSRVYVREGEWISPGQPVVLVADLNHMEVETTDLNEIDVARIQEGDPVKVSFDALPDVVVDGTVVRIATKSAEGSGVNYTVTVTMDEIPAKVRWGMTAFVDIEVQE